MKIIKREQAHLKKNYNEITTFIAGYKIYLSNNKHIEQIGSLLNKTSKKLELSVKIIDLYCADAFNHNEESNTMVNVINMHESIRHNIDEINKHNKVINKVTLARDDFIQLFTSILKSKDLINPIEQIIVKQNGEDEIIDLLKRHSKNSPSKFRIFFGFTKKWLYYGDNLIKLTDDFLAPYHKQLLSLKKELKIKNSSIIAEAKSEIKINEKSKEKLTSECDEYKKKINDYYKKLKDEFGDVLDDDLTFEAIVKNGFYEEQFKNKLDDKNIRKEIVESWVDRLATSSEKDKNRLKKIYIDNANVIGITCVQSGTLGFTNQYPDFDIVIIDEVSKATPPELLLPMLKGKKIILVGDHKQLPPMLDAESLEEVAENNGYSSEEIEHLGNCIFKELYEDAPDELKMMLKIQYRMHPQIMNTINQFYDYELENGIKEPDETKKHNCQNSFIKESNHAMWIDMPLGELYAEERQGTSFYNTAEINTISKILSELDEQYGINSLDVVVQKEVGIITFYGAQTKRLQNEFIVRNKYKNLNLRIGTVDRFQGMERPIIIVSFVRNNKEGNIGFAKKPERINVALSRAQELLIIVGCAGLFCEASRNSDSIKIYKNVIENINKEGGYKNVLELT